MRHGQNIGLPARGWFIRGSVMKTPYADQIVNAMRAQNRPAWEIVGYLEAFLTRIQRDAEEGNLTPQSLLENLAAHAAPDEPAHP